MYKTHIKQWGLHKYKTKRSREEAARDPARSYLSDQVSTSSGTGSENPRATRYRPILPILPEVNAEYELPGFGSRFETDQALSQYSFAMKSGQLDISGPTDGCIDPSLLERPIFHGVSQGYNAQRSQQTMGMYGSQPEYRFEWTDAVSQSVTEGYNHPASMRLNRSGPGLGPWERGAPWN